MELKEIVAQLLKTKDRPFEWLATEMNMTADGLKLSLLKESLKYVKLKQLAEIFEVSPEYLFTGTSADKEPNHELAEEMANYASLKSELNSCKELVDALKSQMKDKDRIIGLLSKEEPKDKGH